MERIVTERPETSFFAIHIDTGFTHGAVEEQGYFLVGRGIKTRAIPTGAYIRQSPGTSCFQGCLFLEILCDGNILKVVVHVERTENSPVVRNDDRFPFCVIKLRLTSLFEISFTELPVLLEQRLAALRLQAASGSQQKYSYKLFLVFHVHFLFSVINNFGFGVKI